MRMRDIDLPLVEVGIAAMQEPSFFALDSNCTVPSRMPGNRNQKDILVASTQKRAHSRKAIPRLAFKRVDLPIDTVLPVHGSVALPFAKCARLHSGEVFVFINMYLRARKIGQATDMVEVKVRGNDVPHVVGVKTQRFNLPQRSEFFIELGIRQCQEYTAEPFVRIFYIIATETSVDQHEPLVGLDQKRMADEMRISAAEASVVHQWTAEWTERAGL